MCLMRYYCRYLLGSLYGVLAIFLSIHLYVENRMLSGHVHIGVMVDCELGFYCLWLVCQQFHYLVCLNGL